MISRTIVFVSLVIVSAAAGPSTAGGVKAKLHGFWDSKSFDDKHKMEWWFNLRGGKITLSASIYEPRGKGKRIIGLGSGQAFADRHSAGE